MILRHQEKKGDHPKKRDFPKRDKRLCKQLFCKNPPTRHLQTRVHPFFDVRTISHYFQVRSTRYEHLELAPSRPFFRTGKSRTVPYGKTMFAKVELAQYCRNGYCIVSSGGHWFRAHCVGCGRAAVEEAPLRRR